MNYYRKQKNSGLKFLSITDHESVEAYYEMDRKLFHGMLIPGVELRTICCGVAIELLAYGFDLNIMRKNLKKYHYMDTQELDSYMIKLAFEQYVEKGVKLDSTFIEDFENSNAPRLSKYIQAAIDKYPENQKFLIGLPEGKSFFRYCMTNPNHPLFLDLSSAFPTISELTSSIREAHGLISIPHIFEYKENAEKILFELLSHYDIDMIECYYSSFSKEQTEFLLNVCQKHKKFSSGGSDFHGNLRVNVELGHGTDNNLLIPEEKIQSWIPLLHNIL